MCCSFSSIPQNYPIARPLSSPYKFICAAHPKINEFPLNRKEKPSDSGVESDGAGVILKIYYSASVPEPIL